MHDNVINNAFFALLAVGGGLAGLHAFTQVVFGAQSLEVTTTFTQYAATTLLGV